MAIQRRTAPAPAAVEGVNFGSMEMYVQGGGMPEGDYALEFSVLMFQATTQAGVPRGPARLGVQVTAHSLTGSDEKPREQFYSMGRNADKSFAPDPDTGKGLVPIPGAPAGTLPNSTNWALFLKSLYDSGLPQGVFTNDLSVLDGVWVHIANVPEPEDRKSFAPKTGEAATEERMGSGMVAVVTEIKDDGKPWEGSGGVPEAGTPAPAAKVTKVAGKITPKVAPKPLAKKAAAPAPVEEAADEGAIESAAINGATAVLEASPDGVTKLLMRTGTFKHVSTAEGADMAQAVIETYFGSDEALNAVLGQLGYKVSGQKVVPV